MLKVKISPVLQKLLCKISRMLSLKCGWWGNNKLWKNATGVDNIFTSSLILSSFNFGGEAWRLVEVVLISKSGYFCVSRNIKADELACQASSIDIIRLEQCISISNSKSSEHSRLLVISNSLWMPLLCLVCKLSLCWFSEF